MIAELKDYLLYHYKCLQEDEYFWDLLYELRRQSIKENLINALWILLELVQYLEDIGIDIGTDVSIVYNEINIFEREEKSKQDFMSFIRLIIERGMNR